MQPVEGEALHACLNEFIQTLSPAELEVLHSADRRRVPSLSRHASGMMRAIKPGLAPEARAVRYAALVGLANLAASLGAVEGDVS